MNEKKQRIERNVFYKYKSVYVPGEHYEGLVNIGMMPGKHENAWNC